MKYDSQITDFKAKLDSAKKVLVVLPSQVNNDKMAAALALYLSLKQAQKDVSIVSEAEIRVSQSVLYGVGDVKKELPAGISGNFIMSFEGVVVDGKVPSLVDLNYYPEGSTLNLVFNVVPGQKFEPINIRHRYDDVNFDLIITVGVSNLNHIGSMYAGNQDKFTATPKINIDSSNNNNSYGEVNILDHGVSISEMVMHILQGMSLPLDQDIATNIITGVYDSTRGLTSNVTSDTFLAIGEAMQIGGKIVRQTSGTGGDRPQQQPQQQSQGLDVRQFPNQKRNDQRNPQRPDNRPNPQNPQPVIKQSDEGEQSSSSSQPQNDRNTNPGKRDEQQNEQIRPSMPEKKEELVKDILSNQKDEGPVGGILQPFKEPYTQNTEPVSQRDSVSVEDKPADPVTDSTSQAPRSDSDASTETPTPAETDSDVIDTTKELNPEPETPKTEAPIVANTDKNTDKLTPTDSADLVEKSEVPAGEQVSSSSPETPAPDWLTPKIFKGGNLG